MPFGPAKSGASVRRVIELGERKKNGFSGKV
jgi:hypothetical protein